MLRAPIQTSSGTRPWVCRNCETSRTVSENSISRTVAGFGAADRRRKSSQPARKPVSVSADCFLPLSKRNKSFGQQAEKLSAADSSEAVYMLKSRSLSARLGRCAASLFFREVEAERAVFIKLHQIGAMHEANAGLFLNELHVYCSKSR